MKKATPFKNILRILEELHRKYPTYTVGRHISTALSDYGDFWGITDKEFEYALSKYESELELDSSHIVSEQYISDILKDTEELFNPKDEWDEPE